MPLPDIDDPRWTVTCQRCGEPFRRRSMQGAPPKRCEDCKLAIKRETIDKLRAKQLQKPHYDQPDQPDEPEPPAEPEPAVVAKVDPSWLDDAEAQELLVERQRREQGVEEHDGHTIAVEAWPSPSEVVEQPRTGHTPWSEIKHKQPDDVVMSDAFDEPEDSAERLCIVADCLVPDPTHVDRFCTSHWQRISLEVRGVLLGASQGSAPFDQAVGRALRQLRG